MEIISKQLVSWPAFAGIVCYLRYCFSCYEIHAFKSTWFLMSLHYPSVMIHSQKEPVTLTQFQNLLVTQFHIWAI